MYIERKRHENQETMHKMYDKESFSSLRFSWREAAMCADSDSREKVDRGGNRL